MAQATCTWDNTTASRKRTRTKRYNEESWQAGRHTPNTGISSKATLPSAWRNRCRNSCVLPAMTYGAETWARIRESVITYDGHISRPGITELELGPSENSYSRARKRSVIVVLEVGGFHTGCLVTKRCTAHGRRVICPARQSSGEWHNYITNQ